MNVLIEYIEGERIIKVLFCERISFEIDLFFKFEVVLFLFQFHNNFFKKTIKNNVIYNINKVIINVINNT